MSFGNRLVTVTAHLYHGAATIEEAMTRTIQ